jgi:hypothetical protein
MRHPEPDELRRCAMFCCDTRPEHGTLMGVRSASRFFAYKHLTPNGVRKQKLSTSNSLRKQTAFVYSLKLFLPLY